MKYEVIGTLMDENSQVPMAKEIVPVSIPIHNYKILTMLLPPEILIIFEKISHQQCVFQTCIGIMCCLVLQIIN